MFSESPIDIVLLHVLPSVWINAGMFYHLAVVRPMAVARPAPARPGPPAHRRRAPATLPGKAALADPGRVEGDAAAGDAAPSPGAHLCRTCGTRCRDMDHHCVFTANCVGRFNYAFFVGFVFWGWAATVYGVFLSVMQDPPCRPPGGPARTAGGAACRTTDRDGAVLWIAGGSCAVMTCFLALVLCLARAGNTVRGFLRGRAAADPAANPGRLWLRILRETWPRLLVPGSLGYARLRAELEAWR